jgi:hypothetical protein
MLTQIFNIRDEHEFGPLIKISGQRMIVLLREFQNMCGGSV